MFRTSLLVLVIFNCYKDSTKKPFTNSRAIWNAKQKPAPMSPPGRTGHKETQVWQYQQSKKGNRKASKTRQLPGHRERGEEPGLQNYEKPLESFQACTTAKCTVLEAIFKPRVVATGHQVSYFWLGVLCTQVTFLQYPNAQVAKMIKIS